jgi:hypothetical protein
MEAEVLGEVPQAVQMRARVATHAKNINGCRYALAVHQVAMLSDHLVHEGRVGRDVRHPREKLHTQIEGLASVQKVNQRVCRHVVLLRESGRSESRRIVRGKRGKSSLLPVRRESDGVDTPKPITDN